MLSQIFSQIFILAVCAFAQYIEPELCKKRCYCSESQSIVDCNLDDKVIGVPANIPSGVVKLFIHGGVFAAPGHLSRKNLTNLSHLNSLRIIKSQLRSIDSRTFLGMTNLRHLDLSNNWLTHLNPQTFYGLTLENLYLQQQTSMNDAILGSHLTYISSDKLFIRQALSFSEDAFNGLSAEQINLKGNRISDIHFSLFENVKDLKRLILSSNLIQNLDVQFSKYFDKHNKLIDLTDNPLICKCELAWLAGRVKEWVNISPSLNITCLVKSLPKEAKTDSALKDMLQFSGGIELHHLSTRQLCLGSRIGSVGIDVAPSGIAATLSCTAVTVETSPLSTVPDSGLGISHVKDVQVVGHRLPPVAWNYIEAGQMRQVRRLPNSAKDVQSLNIDKQTATVKLNVSITHSERQFTCITWDENENDQQVLIKIRGPSEYMILDDNIKPGVLDALNQFSHKNNENLHQSESFDSLTSKLSMIEELSYTDVSFFLRKQFTLLELIGAIIGTFLVTLILLLFGSRCILILRHYVFGLSRSRHNFAISDSKDAHNLNHNRESELLKTTAMLNGNIFNSTANATNSIRSTLYDVVSSTNSTYNLTFNPLNVTPFSQSSRFLTNPTYRQLIPDFKPNLPISATTPLIATNSLQHNLLIPGLHGNPQQLAFWPMSVGSTHSPAGSYEYDIPRCMDASQITCDQPVG